MKFEDETLIRMGDTVKATKLDNGDVKLSGYLVRYGDPDTLDLDGDYFAEDTDFGKADSSLSWFNHRHPVHHDGMSMAYKDQLPDTELTMDKVGILATIIIGSRNEYEKMLAEQGLAGKLSWSSGTASHLMDYERQDNGAYKIARWILGLDASLTPTPAEPKNVVMPIKSLSTPDTEQTADADGKEGEGKTIENIEENTMDEKEMKALFASVLEEAVSDIKESVKETVEETVKAMTPKEPDIKAGVAGVEVIEDEADKALRLNPFKTDGEFYQKVAYAAIPERGPIDKRLLAMKSTGLNETIPSEGGFLVGQQRESGIVTNMWSTGTVLSRFTARPIGPGSNGMLVNLIDETSRVAGSRRGGVLGYWLEEGGTKLPSKPKYRQLDLKLKKVAALMYATDELIADAVALEAEINILAPDELRFMVEDAIIEGNGVGMPLGILTSNALVSATRLNATQINSQDISSMWMRRYVGPTDYVWFANPDITVFLHQMTIGNQPVYQPPGGLSERPFATLLGRPYFEIEYCPTLGTAGDLMLVSPSQYRLIDKGGIESASSIHVKFVEDETAFRFVYRVNGAPEWEQPVTPFKGSSTVSPFVVLGAST